MSEQRILIIEDDTSIRQGLEDTLRAKGYAVRSADRGGEGLRKFAEELPDLVILDLMLPDMEGFDICKKLKAWPGQDVPVIILTARGAELDRVRGLELGADDYVTKPFSLMELLARVAVVLRRAGRGGGPAVQAPATDTISFEDVFLDFRRHEGTKRGKPLKLSDRAYVIMQVFARHRGEVLSRERLLEEAWGYSRELNTRTVDNHVVKIRQQLEDDPNSPRYLVTVHGVGYKLAV